MQVLPEAFFPMAEFNQFVLWVSRPSKTRPGKTDKITINPVTGAIADAHDSMNWLPANAAIQVAPIFDAGVGFVFTDRDPFFFFDIDNCVREDGHWSDLSQKLCAQFAGCAVEISHSNRGLHIFGVGRPAGDYKHKNQGLGLELYHDKRFVALTGNGARGNAGHTGPLDDLVTEYFTRSPDDIRVDAEWTDGPSADWNGPVDDDALINRALRSKSAAGAFSGRASFRDLWEANSEKLSQCYPDSSREYDASSADAALCQHLAFWTGRDCERIDRVFRKSGLLRDKWEIREDYRRVTITGAISRCKSVYNTKPTAVANEVEGFQYLPISAQIEHFDKCVYIRDLHRAFIPDGSLLKPEQFKATYGGHVFAMDSMNDKTTRNAWEAFTESQGYRFPKATGICFRPEEPPAAVIDEEGYKLVNIYVPIKTRSMQGDVGPFMRHLAKLIPNRADQTIILSYMAACVQYPGKKFQWTPLIQGCEGNGKSLLINCMANSIGWRYTHLPNAADLGNKFNPWVVGKLFAGVEEVYVADKREISEPLKRLITDSRIEIQGKGADQVMGDNRANFIMCTNHKDAVRKTRTDRRFGIFYTAQQNPSDMSSSGMTGGYFPTLYDWLRADGYAIVTNFLRTYDIPDEFNPATMCHRAPITSSTPEAISVSMGGVEQEVAEAIAEDRPGMAGGWVSSMALAKLLEDHNASRKLPRNRRSEMLREFGYVLHPNLPGGRVNNRIPLDNGRPTLYIHTSNPGIGLTVAADIVKAYLGAQGVI